MHNNAEWITQKRILVVQLVSLGDCLFVTTIAQQIKHDYPGCHLTWAISNRCSQIIRDNPNIDEIWEIFLEKMSDAWGDAWKETKKKALEKKENGLYDYIFFTQLYPDNFSNYDGSIRSSTFRGYPNPITTPVTPFIRLDGTEIENVRIFAEQNKLEKFRHVILFECSPGSIQSQMNHHFALEVSKKIADKFEDAVILLTSNQKIDTHHDRIIDASVLTFRENAELSKYCNLLIGCSSGITWLLTSNWAKKLPTIQILKKRALEFEFASVSYDLEYWGQPIDHIIEITKFDEEYVSDCVKMTFEEGISEARKKYNEKLKPNFISLILIIADIIYFKKFKEITKVIRNFHNRNNYSMKMIIPIIIITIPYIMYRILLRYFINIKKNSLIV